MVLALIWSAFPKTGFAPPTLGGPCRILDQLCAQLIQKQPAGSQGSRGAHSWRWGLLMPGGRAQLRATSAAAARCRLVLVAPRGPGEPGTESRATRRQGHQGQTPDQSCSRPSLLDEVLKEHNPTTNNPFLMKSPWNKNYSCRNQLQRRQMPLQWKTCRITVRQLIVMI